MEEFERCFNYVIKVNINSNVMVIVRIFEMMDEKDILVFKVFVLEIYN